MKKFLVIQTAFIGDVVLATGIIEKLHRFYPEAQIDFLVRKGNESLLNNHPFLHEVLVWEKRKDKYKNLFKILNTVRENKYDVVINVQRYAATGFITVFSGAKTTIGFDKNPWSFLFTKKIKHRIGTKEHIVHEIERNNDLIAHLTDDKPERPKIYPSQKDYEKVQPLQQTPYICIAPASVWFTKQYPKEKWIAFINSLPSHLNIFLIGGKEDRTLGDEIKNSSQNAGVTNFCGQLNFLESAALQQKAVMNYVNDSAPMHFASAVNAPVTAVYCSTVPEFGYGPLSDKSYIVQTEVFLDCKPCGIHGYQACPLKHFKCAHTIKEEQLLQTLEAYI
jgi:heptosyltransferase II